MTENAFYLNVIKPKPITPLDWTEKFILSVEQAEKISDPDWIYDNLIIQGHVVAIVAEPNGGKTTLLFHISGVIADAGYTVIYVNADVSGGDAKSMVFDARARGFTLLLPDMAGQSMESVVNELSAMNDAGGDFSNVVFIFDTLKKMTEVINKSKAKELYQLLRSLSAKGMTIILLAHTNKYKDNDGNPVFEGTGDLRSDVDELIYLIPEKRTDGSMVISTKPDKVRGAFHPISFEISASRQVRPLDVYVNTILSLKDKAQTEKDATVIEVITEAIQDGKFKQKDIVTHCKDNGIGWRSCEAVLKRHMQGNSQGFESFWFREKSFENNAWNYQLINEGTPPFPMVKVKRGESGETGF
jgi:KaiC/GvpD/RAD55 family RecA-like ATPase